MYYLYFFGKAIISIFPRNFCYLAARFISIVQYYLSKKDREAVIYNLSPVVKEKDKLKKYAREVFINFAYYLVDFFRYSELNRNFIKKYVRISGWENLEKALGKGRGVIVFTAHLGNYELAGAIIALLGYPLSVVALSHKDKRINKFFDSQRQRAGIKVIPVGVSKQAGVPKQAGAAIRGCFTALKRGDMLALLGDRDFSGQGPKLEMFSRYAYFPRGISFFALKTKAPVIPIFLVRENKKFYHLIFEKAVSYCPDQQNETAVIEQCNKVIERYIKKYPEQWYMFQKYWLEEDEGRRMKDEGRGKRDERRGEERG